MSQRWGIYLMTVFSLGVLASLFASRGQTIWAVGFAILAAGYLARGIFQQVRENKEHHQELDDRMSGRKTSAEKRAIVDKSDKIRVAPVEEDPASAEHREALAKDLEEYGAGAANGITTSAYGTWAGSYVVLTG